MPPGTSPRVEKEIGRKKTGGYCKGEKGDDGLETGRRASGKISTPHESEETRDNDRRENEPSTIHDGAGRGEKEKKTESEGNQNISEEETTVTIKPGELAEEGKKIEKTLKEIRRELEKILDEVRNTMGEYKAIKGFLEGERTVGQTPGIVGEAEYRKMKILTIPIEIQFLREVGESISDSRITYTRHSDDAYWLPAEEDEVRDKVLLLLDSSPSIRHRELELFMNLVKKAIEIYDIEYDVTVFSVGEVERKTLHVDNIDEETFKIKRGAGTVWDASIAKRIREASDQGIRLIQILSDFHIIVHPVVLDEFRRFKAIGGRVSCYSVTGIFLPICDFKHFIQMG